MIHPLGPLFVSLALSFTLAEASTPVTMDDLLARDARPAGVVFEIVASDDGLTRAIPEISEHVRVLRQRWPDLEIAVVSHGVEQFALTRKNAESHDKVHKGVQRLIKESQVPVHVCETHASWNGVSPEDFPDYVDVTPAGPVQIRMYQDLGYELVFVGGY